MSVIIKDGWLSGSLPDDTGREWPVVQRRQESLRGPLRPERPLLILHTTETNSYIQQLRFPSQWQCGDGQIGQHIRLGLSGDAVNDWDTYAQQIEMVGRSQVARWLPENSTLGPTVALVAWLHRTERIKTGLTRPAPWPIEVDRLPAAVEGYYRRHEAWPDKLGVYGHIDIPGNSHWDPGGFDYPRFFARVQTAIEGGTDMAILTPDEEKQLRNFLKELRENLGNPTAIQAGTRVAAAVKDVEAGTGGVDPTAFRPGDVVKLNRP